MSDPANKDMFPLGPIFRSLPAAYLVMDAGLRVIDATDSYESSTRNDRSNYIGKNILDAFPENPNTSHLEARQNLEASLNFVQEHKQPHTMPLFRFDINRPDGSYDEHFWETTNYPILDESNALQYILLETRDVTEVKHQEQENFFTRARLNLLAGALDAVTWEYDSLQDKIHWSNDVFSVFGYSPEQMPTGRDAWKQLVHPEELPEIEQNIKLATSTGENIWTSRYRFKAASNTYVQVLDQRYIIYDRQGKTRKMIGSLINVSKSNRSEVEAKESNARFQHLLEVLPFMAWTAAPNGQLLHFNKAWHSFTGMPYGHTDRWVSYIHPEDTAEVLTSWHEAIRSGCPFEVEYRVYNKYESDFQWFLERGLPLHDEKGNIKIWIGTFTDIHDRKQALEQP